MKYLLIPIILFLSSNFLKDGEQVEKSPIELDKISIINTVLTREISSPKFPPPPPIMPKINGEPYTIEDSLLHTKVIAEHEENRKLWESKIHLLSIVDTLRKFEDLTDKDDITESIKRKYKGILINYKVDKKPEVISIQNIKQMEGWELHIKGTPYNEEIKQIESTIEFSEILFNEKHTIAGIHVWVKCGLRCGYGGYLILEKKNENWQVIDVLSSSVV